MKLLHKTIIALLVGFAALSHAAEDEDSTDQPVARADFASKLLLIPCVEVTNTAFDGFWDVVMEVSGDGSGQQWKISKATRSAEGECGSAPSDKTTDELLKSMGMPSTSELIKNTNITSSITSTVNSAVNAAISSALGTKP